MENGPFEDVFPIKHGDIPASFVSLAEGIAPKNGKIFHFFLVGRVFGQIVKKNRYPTNSAKKDGFNENPKNKSY